MPAFYTICANLMRTAFVLLFFLHLCRREYKLLLPSAAVFLLTFVPDVLGIWQVRPDAAGALLYLVILVMTIYLGNALKFYERFAWWDRLAHFLAGASFVSFGLALARREGDLHKLHALAFALTFSITLHVLWEVLEYLSDSLFHTDHQRWQKNSATHNHQPEAALQPAGLVDTMNDTIVCLLGGVCACLIWWAVL